MAEDDELWVAQGDLKNCFYQIELPQELRCFFALRCVRAGTVNVREIDGVAVQLGTWISPVLRVVPMGWKWALFW
eukprot:4295683-Amphidinium_carterae.1